MFFRVMGALQIRRYVRPSRGVVCEPYDLGTFEIDADVLEPRPLSGETRLFR